MIKIYSKDEINNLEDIINNNEVWDYPIEEIDYLLKEKQDESFVLIDNRLYEYTESDN